jgi:hypothetical protein
MRGATATPTRLSSGDLRRILGAEFDRKGRPLGRGPFDRLLRDYPELGPLEVVAGVRLWSPEALDAFRAVLTRERGR